MDKRQLETVPEPGDKPEKTAAKGIQTEDELGQLQAANVLAREELEQFLQKTRQMKAATALTNRRFRETFP